MKRLTMEEAYGLGREHGFTMAQESGTSDAGCDGWDGILINANPQFARESFGWDGDDSSDEAKALLNEYCRGCQDGANAAIEARDTNDYDECVYEVEGEDRTSIARYDNEFTAIERAKGIANSRVIMHVKSGTHETATCIYPKRGETYSN